MENIIKAVNDLELIYLEGSAIDKIVIDVPNKKVTVSYTYDTKPDEFDSLEDMVKFLDADQNSD